MFCPSAFSARTKQTSINYCQQNECWDLPYISTFVAQTRVNSFWYKQVVHLKTYWTCAQLHQRHILSHIIQKYIKHTYQESKNLQELVWKVYIPIPFLNNNLRCFWARERKREREREREGRQRQRQMDRQMQRAFKLWRKRLTFFHPPHQQRLCVALATPHGLCAVLPHVYAPVVGKTQSKFIIIQTMINSNTLVNPLIHIIPVAFWQTLAISS